MLLFALACAPDPVAFCEGPTRQVFEASRDAHVTQLPDDHWMVEDPNTPNGTRIALTPEVHPGLDFPENYASWYDDLSTLDGWGLSSGIWFTLTGQPWESLDDEDVVVAYRTDGDWIQADMELRVMHHGWSVMMRPLRPFPPQAEVVAVVLSDPAAPDCLEPSLSLKELLDPEGHRVDDPPLGARYRAALDDLGLQPQQVGAMTVFTTQSATTQGVEVADRIAQMDPELRFDTCVDEGGHWECSGHLDTVDFRDESRTVPPGEVLERGRYDLPVTLWLPPGEGPFPTIVCGHGLGGDRYDCDALIDEVTAAGVAMIGVDAVEHGDHPTRSEFELELLEPLAIFAISVDPPALNALQLRDNFRQSAWDKLQLIQAIHQGVDVDADGLLELDPDRIAYAGVSLGGLMGPEPLALSTHLRGGWLAVGGGRVTQIISDSESFSLLIDVMKPSDFDDGDVEQGLQVLQMVVDAGDPAVWAAHVQRDRLVGGEAPDIYLGAVLDDDVVPNTANDNLALAFGAPGVGTEHWSVPTMGFTPGSVQANGPDGASLGYVQHAQVHHDGEPREARHANLHNSDEGKAAIEALLWARLFDDGRGVVLDPAD